MPACLILINGLPGIGKSTLARRYVDEHPLALLLEVDALRTALGAWAAHEESKRLARALGLAAARTHLAAGHDVVVPQLIARVEFVETLAEVASRAGAAFHELLVVDSLEASRARFLVRREALAAAGARHPESDLSAAELEAALAASHRVLLALAEARPGTRIVRNEAGRLDAAYRALLAAICADGGRGSEPGTPGG